MLLTILEKEGTVVTLQRSEARSRRASGKKDFEDRGLPNWSNMDTF